MNLEQIRDGWNAAAVDDAMFNIMTLPEYAGGKWPVDEFFATGEEEIQGVLDHLKGIGIESPASGAALDFGCGLGRLTQALATRYDFALGIDISREMTALARKYAKERVCGNCHFATNSRPDLRSLGPQRFAFIYSIITLQHMPQDLQRGYIEEFVRVLAPGGLAVFQTPEGGNMENGHLSMFGVAPAAVEAWVDHAGGKILDRELSHHTGIGFDGWRYAVSK